MTNNKMEWEKVRNEDDNLALARAHSAFEYKPATESEIAKAWETFEAMVHDSKQHVMDWRNRVSLGKLAPDQTPAKSFDCSTCGSRYDHWMNSTILLYYPVPNKRTLSNKRTR